MDGGHCSESGQMNSWTPGYAALAFWPQSFHSKPNWSFGRIGKNNINSGHPFRFVCLSGCQIKLWFDSFDTPTGRCPNFYSNWQVSWPDQQQSVNAGGAAWFTTFLFWFFFFWCFLSPSWLIDGRFSVTTVLINVWSSGICLFVRPGKECEGGQLLIVVKRF